MSSRPGLQPRPRFSIGGHEYLYAARGLVRRGRLLNATAGSWLDFRDYEGKVLLYFTQLMSYRPLLKEVRYSLNSDALDRTFKFKPGEKMFEVGDELYLAVPNDSQFATVQVTFKDGSVSAAQKIVRTK